MARATRKTPAAKASRSKASSTSRKPAAAKKTSKAPARASKPAAKKAAPKKPAPKKPAAKKPAAKKAAPSKPATPAVKKPAKAAAKPAKKPAPAPKKATATIKPAKPAAKVAPAPKPAPKAAAPKPAPPPPPEKPKKKAKPELRPKEIEKIKGQLLEQRATFLREFTELEEGTFMTSQSEMSGESSFDEEYADAGSFTFEREKELSIGNNIRDLLDKVNAALAAIERGTYGICENCGDPINRDRLLALPYSTLCIRCKQIEERASR